MATQEDKKGEKTKETEKNWIKIFVWGVKNFNYGY